MNRDDSNKDQSYSYFIFGMSDKLDLYLKAKTHEWGVSYHPKDWASWDHKCLRHCKTSLAMLSSGHENCS